MRTYGETVNCAGCRYWSEMLARVEGGGPLEAMCLGPGSKRGHYVSERMTCGHWASGHFGPVDAPGEGEAIRAEYEAEMEKKGSEG